MRTPQGDQRKAHYLQVLRDDAAAFATAIRSGAEAIVPSCPGWLVADAAIHLGSVHRQWTLLLQNPDAPDPNTARRVALGETLPAGLAWFERPRSGQTDLERIPSNLATWFEDGAARLIDFCRQVDSSVPLLLRGAEEPIQIPRLLLGLATESAVHRWDAQDAHGWKQPINRLLAEEGITHMFEYIIPGHRAWAREHNKVPPPRGKGERYLFQQIDGRGQWFMHWEGDTPLIKRSGAEADVVVRGAASDLYLFLWHRLSARSLMVGGDTDLLDRYFDLASL